MADLWNSSHSVSSLMSLQVLSHLVTVDWLYSFAQKYLNNSLFESMYKCKLFLNIDVQKEELTYTEKWKAMFEG